ncbi:LysE family translocator [Staphylococcus arlettae]|uniref:LysE family translocator n=1 Tax=Staphylococcus TaxID=1279 RepID=UPI000853AF28|nr:MULTISPECIES: LysE family translocator [Staphylococcus]OEK72889.1 lysine transporter LysE [Staphylococcus equorum]PTI77425.1 LysE family translocator [Staphylococcus xylosus]PUZ31133.1 LysE family translocator [Staphylococcus arlettae]RIL78244.1 LysE family translocator [Staphylococcus cohnii]RIM69594.1 LysE family translocator [Staphylococcus arlettae]
MLSLFITYIILGISLSLPAGTMTIEMSKQGLKNGFFHGWFVGIGGMTVDLAMILVIYFGFSDILMLPTVETIMWLIGFICLLYIGIDSIKESNQPLSINEEGIVKNSFLKAYGRGLLMAITPSNIVFWIGVFGTALTTAINNVSGYQFLFVASGILVGILIHDVVLMGIISYTRKFVNQFFIKWTSIIAGVLLIGFGIYFGYLFIHDLRNLL